MGRKGDLLRAAKAQASTYTFTRAQLEAHDEAVKAEYRKSIMERVKAEAAEIDRQRDERFREKAEALWAERRDEFQTGSEMGDLQTAVAWMLAVSVRVLVERFGWVPIRNGHRTRLRRFAEGVLEELEKIQTDEKKDIIWYARETEDKYGVRFLTKDAEEEQG